MQFPRVPPLTLCLSADCALYTGLFLCGVYGEVSFIFITLAQRGSNNK